MKFLIELNDLPLVERSRLATETGDTELLKVLAEDVDWRIREEVAKSDKVSAEILQKLAEDVDEDVRISVAENDRVTVDTLLKLILDDDNDVAKSAFITYRDKMKK